VKRRIADLIDVKKNRSANSILIDSTRKGKTFAAGSVATAAMCGMPVRSDRIHAVDRLASA
jgi:hypothetical protein